ncbi:MAG: RluA family pseudouridine synthase [Clostridiales Family XIII bacterium]|jgi:23S rRNA pseudouridine1911/1915/1917 synthase|nr:RluA family pseudouridine synthase [Clostridiales Family XIII bacterium]
MSGFFSFVADESEAGARLDVLVAERVPGVSRSHAQNLISAGAVSVNGAPVGAKSRAVKAGDVVGAIVPEPRALELEAEDIPVDVVYEDGHLLVVDKPKGMVVHPAPGNEGGTLVNALLFHCGGKLSSINGVLRPGIVHRIDKDTSGLLVVAKSDEAHRALSAALAAHDVRREYEALVHNNFIEDEGTVRLPIGRDPANRLRQAVVAKGGREAVTRYRVLERFGAFTRLSLSLETGRTHQIRVHMAHVKRPVVGDPLYGPKRKALGAESQLLHAGLLGFRHPATGEMMEFRSPRPEDFERALARLRG